MSLEHKPIKLTEEQINYEKSAEKQASKAKTFIEKITGKGIDKEDIIKIDAGMERDAREGKFNDTNYHMQKWRPLEDYNLTQEENIKRIANSNVVLEDLGETNGDYPTILKGKINGYDVNIKLKNRVEVYSRRNFEGTMDNKELSEEEAKEIFDMYSPVAEEREKRIGDLKEEIKNNYIQ